MPNVLDANGLQVRTREELVTIFTNGYKAIYGDDINLSSDTPDGQKMNIDIQMVLDQQDLMVQIFNSFNPDYAVGKVLDQRAGINGVIRQAGTYTVTNITLTASKSINLSGLDIEADIDKPLNAYTISDNAGNKWYLMESQVGLGAGVHVLAFRAAVPGAQLTIPNTIRTQISIISGVTNVDNPTNALTIGVNEESDAVLKVRRQRSVAGGSQGYYAGLKSALENTPGVTSAFIYENDTDATDADGTPSHSIWVVVAGSALPVNIATAIYRKRNAGCGMRGDQSYDITQIDGTIKEIRWDNVILQNVYIYVLISAIDPSVPPNIGLIRQTIAEQFKPGVNEILDVTSLGTIVQLADPNAYVNNAGFGDGRIQSYLFSNGTPNAGSYKISYGGVKTPLIAWNASDATIQTAIRTIPALSQATVQTSGGTKTITIVDGTDPLFNIDYLITITDNTVSNPFGAINITTDFEMFQTLAPASKRKQFFVAFQNTVVQPIDITPRVSTVLPGTVINFQGVGGYGAYKYGFFGPSSSTINPTTGVYTAGPSAATDTISVFDEFGFGAYATVTII